MASVEDPHDDITRAVIAAVNRVARTCVAAAADHVVAGCAPDTDCATAPAFDVGELIGVDCEHLANDPDCQLAGVALAVQDGD